MKVGGTVAVSLVELTNVVFRIVPLPSGFITTFAFEAKPVPFTVIVVPGVVFTGALAGLTGELTDRGPASTVKVSALLAVVPTLTVTWAAAPPPVSEVAIVAVNCVSEPPPWVTPVVAPFH